MGTLVSPRPPVKASRKPLLPVQVVGRFIGGATAEDLLIGAAVLEIEDGRELTSYWCQANTDRGSVVGYSLRKFVTGDVYDLPRDLNGCDCPDQTFKSERPGGCRHMVALRQALAAAPPAVRKPDRKTERDELCVPCSCDQ